MAEMDCSKIEQPVLLENNVTSPVLYLYNRILLYFSFLDEVFSADFVVL
jgi:hypothetical protein